MPPDVHTKDSKDIIEDTGDPLLKAFFENDEIVEMTVISGGAGFQPVTYKKLEGPYVDIARGLGGHFDIISDLLNDRKQG